MKDSRRYILMAFKWLLLAQEKGGGGYSIGFSLRRGWRQAYPETTGYIIPTMLRIWKRYGWEEALNSALEAGNWLLKIQNKDGSYWEPDFRKPMVFDTGQVIFGLLSLYEITKKQQFLETAIKAGNWIISVQNEDGTWTKFAFNNQPHTYYARVAWALLKLWEKTGIEDYKQAAVRHLDWVVSQQKDNGWFRNASFLNDEKPVLHTIVYVIRSLLESSIILNNKKYFNSSKKAVVPLLERLKKDGILYSYYDSSWRPVSKEKCLPGIAQYSIVLFRFYELEREYKYLKWAMYLTSYLKRKMLNLPIKTLQGCLFGSSPPWGSYLPLMCPNWGVKFFIDALLYEDIYIEDFISQRFNEISNKLPSDLDPHDFRLEAIKRHVNLRRKRLLDAGCGSGRFAMYFRELGAEVHGIDISPRLVSLAKRRVQDGTFTLGSVTNIPYPENYFDIIISIEVLQHVPNIKLALKEFHRVLKPGGVIVIIDRNPISIMGALKPIFERLNRWMYKKDDPFRERWYLSKTWREFLEEAGFNIDIMESIQRRWYSLDRFYFIKASKVGDSK
ncbi:methyltransferase domain-containing protein [Thermococcus sp. 9N3]|uniref:methyltransferase domain-containing protein n=1 Tax=Thermococcus sp. 9N3 TaxID=163002 RepID=UPI0014309586|nr:methyltransferase domain-containing protein [Thermococcus sp. 9N3]NJE49565.1 methyltransferase domain-containing protein [Thermococcus sp. 9N3]